MEKKKIITGVLFQLRKPKVPKGHPVEYILHVRWSPTNRDEKVKFKAGKYTCSLMHIMYSRP